MSENANKDFLELLQQDPERNINILSFIADYGLHSFERVGNSVLIRGVSDRPWVFVSSAQAEVNVLRKLLSAEDRSFAAIEDWMVPLVTANREVVWKLSMIQFVLPDDVDLPSTGGRFVSLSPDDASYVYRNSNYQSYLSESYLRDRITRGPTVALYDKNKLVGWALTQDDGAMGALHVLESHRKRGFGFQITLALSRKLRSQGKTPFAYVERGNAAALKLLKEVGFVRQKQVHWFELA